MSKTATIVFRTGSMMAMDINVAIKLANAMLDKGYNVNMFAYGEGATAMLKEQGPKRFPNAGMDLEALVVRGMKLAACETCCIARGIHRGMEVKGGKIGSLTNDLSVFIEGSDRVIMIGR